MFFFFLLLIRTTFFEQQQNCMLILRTHCIVFDGLVNVFYVHIFVVIFLFFILEIFFFLCKPKLLIITVECLMWCNQFQLLIDYFDSNRIKNLLTWCSFNVLIQNLISQSHFNITITFQYHNHISILKSHFNSLMFFFFY